MDVLQTVFNILYEEISQERTGNFGHLSQIPDTSVLRFLDYFRSLEPQEEEPLLHALAQKSLYQFFPRLPLSTGRNMAYQRYLTVTSQMTDAKYYGLRLRQGMLKGSNPLPKAAKASEIRKAIKSVFSQAFGVKIINLGAGYWQYTGQYEDTEVEITIDYSSRFGNQLIYNFCLNSLKHNFQLPVRPFRPLRYESIMGLATIGWDDLQADQLEPAITLLGELIIYAVQLVNNLPLELIREYDLPN